MKIAILDFTGHPLPLLAGLSTAGTKIAAWLGPALPEAELDLVHVAEGEALPALDAYAGYVVSGSEFGVYDRPDWMAPVREFLLAVRAARKPVFGICFGHQLMADCWGGKAELSVPGMVVGVRRYDYLQGRVEAHAWHQDQVVICPPCARITGQADYCPMAALDYEFPAHSVQFHPEYTQEDLRALFARGAGKFITEELVAGAIASFAGAAVDQRLAADQAAALFRAHGS